MAINRLYFSRGNGCSHPLCGGEGRRGRRVYRGDARDSCWEQGGSGSARRGHHNGMYLGVRSHGVCPQIPPHSFGRALASSSLSPRSLNSLGRKGKPFWSPLQKSGEAESSVLLSPHCSKHPGTEFGVGKAAGRGGAVAVPVQLWESRAAPQVLRPTFPKAQLRGHIPVASPVP